LTTYSPPTSADANPESATGRRRPGRWRRLIAAALVAHTGLVLVWLVALLFWRDGWWPFILLNMTAVAPLLLAGVMLLASVVAAVAAEQPRFVVIALVPPLIFAALYSPYIIPDFSAGPEAGNPPDVRVMTFNILNENDDHAAVLEIIDRYEPDVVAIQELKASIAPDFRSALYDTHPNAIVGSPVNGGTTALFSRSPLTATHELDFGIDRPAVFATTTVADHEVVVAAAHLNPAYYAIATTPWRNRPAAIDDFANDQRSQAEQLLDHLATYPDVVAFVGCDCNTRELNQTNQVLSEQLVDPTRELGYPIRRTSLPGTVNERRIGHVDYVWYREPSDVAVTVDGVYRVNDRGGSDHHPVIADFSLASR